MAVVGLAQDAPSPLLPGRLEGGGTLWTHDELVGRWHAQSTGLIDLNYASTTLLSGATCETNRLEGSWSLTDAGLNSLLNEMGIRRGRSGQGIWTISGQIEDVNEADVLQRTRLTFAMARSVQLSPAWKLRMALHGGKGWRRWMGNGIWDSQYLANPVDPASAPSGEFEISEARSYMEGGFELGLSGATTRLSYRMLHLPFNQSLLQHLDASDPYAIRHSLLVSTRQPITDFFESTGWVLTEFQAGARLLSVGAAAAWTFGEDSYFTGFRSATVVSGGLVYRTTGHLNPLVHIAFKRKWMAWFAPQVPIGTPDGRASAGGMQFGLRTRIG